MHHTVVKSVAKESSRRVFYRKMLSLFLLVSFGAYSVDSADEVIVIGAGASGLAAARALTDAGRYKVTVLEARPNRYGGRIWTNTESFQNATGPEVDMGASYIHYPDDTNSVVKLHREFNLPMLEMNREAFLVVRERDSKPYTRTRVEGAELKVEKAFETVGNISSHLKKDISIYTALRQVNQSQLIDDPLSQTFVALQEFSFGSSINNISAKYVNAGYADVSWSEEKIPALGYSKMLDRIVQNSPSDTPLNITLGQEVTEVNVQEDKRVVIRCRNNETYKADAVIVTLPLGVLKANDVKFTPDLSTKKQKAIKRVGFGTVNKLVIEFNKRFWPEDKQHISVAVRDIADRGKFTFMTSFYAIANKPVIVTYAVSQFGEDSEKLSKTQLKNLALRRLRTAFGTALDPVKVVRMSRTRWKRDRFSRGSYSFPALGMEEGDWDILGQPEPPLFFAGEHTRTRQYGTVQTAIDTGRKAAKEVETYLNLVNTAPVKVLSSSVLLCSLLLPVLHMSL